MTTALLNTTTSTFSPALLADKAEHFEQWGYTVHGWFKSPADLEARSGVLIIATRASGMLVLVDVQPAADVAAAYAQLNDSACWRQQARGGLLLGAIYLDQAASGEKELTPFLQEFLRESAASQIRSLEHPICGDK